MAPRADEQLNCVQGWTLSLVSFGHAAREVVGRLRGCAMRPVAHDPCVSVGTMAANRVSTSGRPKFPRKVDYASLLRALTARTQRLSGEQSATWIWTAGRRKVR